MRILFVAMHRPRRSPGQRFRFEQYLDYLRDNGVECDLSCLISEADDRVLYSPGGYAKKAGIFLKSIAIRLRDVFAARRYDVVFIYREALMVNTGVIEWLLSQTRARLVFDYDDAVWLQPVSAANASLGFLRAGPSKIPGILRRMDLVLAGNSYLADYARPYCERVEIMPTTLDTRTHAPQVHAPNPRVCIGWNGSPSTVTYFDGLTPALVRVKQRFGDRVCFKLVGDGRYTNTALELKGQAWREETEVADTVEFDIGLMPLPDDPWTRGKCGFKALLYMSLGIAPVISPVGVNAEIVDDGQNGFLAANDDQWVEAIGKLVEDLALRDTLGKRGRETVVARYSFDSQKDRYLGLLKSLA